MASNITEADISGILARAEQLFSAGQIAQAEKLCRGILDRDRVNAQALHLLAIGAHQSGRLREARALFARAIAVKPTVALYHCNFGEFLRLNRELDAAIAQFNKALSLKPDYVAALNNLGSAHCDKGELEPAIKAFARALALSPELVIVMTNMANALRLQKEHGPALALLQRAVATAPGSAGAHSGLGNVHFDLGDYEKAIAAYQQAVALSPGFAEAHSNLGTALRMLERTVEAKQAYLKAQALQPNNPDILNNLALLAIAEEDTELALKYLAKSAALRPGHHETLSYLAYAHIVQGDFKRAGLAADQALALSPDYPEALNAKGSVLLKDGAMKEALACFRRATVLKPDYAEAMGNIAHALREIGELDEARKMMEDVVALMPSSPTHLRSLSELMDFTEGDKYLGRLMALAAAPDQLNDTQKIHLHFALAKAHTDLKRHEEALEHLVKGCALHRGKLKYDEQGQFQYYRDIQAAFSRDVIRQKAGFGNDSRLPILVIGMPRSGTTLVEQILASHPDVHGAGELTDLPEVVRTLRVPGSKSFPDYVRLLEKTDIENFATEYLARLRRKAPDAKHVTDKMPANYANLGMFHLAFPQARIVHLCRDPVDTCLSCFSKLFTRHNLPFTYDLRELGRYYNAYRELMAHWRQVLPAEILLDVQYEELVSDFEPQVRRMLAHCGLDWDPACLSFQEADRPVKTASSTQVRQKIYTSSVGRWRRYGSGLAPLLEELKMETADAIP